MLQLQGIFETHINVSNLERSMQFYEAVLGLAFARKQEERRVAFYWVGGHNQAMLGIWEKPDQIIRQHFAFQVALEDLPEAADKLRKKGIELRNFLNDGTDQPMVFSWMPALAIYFADPDNHSLEFIAPIPAEPRPEVGVVSWETWERLK